jgi:hypothetical protein
MSLNSFALGTYAQHEHLKHTNSPPHEPATSTPVVFSYDSWCSFTVNLVNRVATVFPEETWFHKPLATVEGQIPTDHINGHGEDCQKIWQVVYFACRSHFHGEMAEMIWAFLNALGSSTRQHTGAAWHDIINFVVDAWNTRKVLGQGKLHGQCSDMTDLLFLQRNLLPPNDLTRFGSSSSTWPLWRTSAGSMPLRPLVGHGCCERLQSLLAVQLKVSISTNPRKV